jgi:hypothetical protein
MSQDVERDIAIMNALKEAALRRPPVAGSGHACLTDQRLLELVDGTIGDSQRLEATGHLSSCRRCQREVSSLIGALNDADVILASGTGRHRLLRVAALLSIAAGAILVITLGDFGKQAPVATHAPHRAPELIPGSQPVGVSPVGPVSNAIELRWSEVPDADAYKVTLFNSEGLALLEAESGENFVVVPDSIRLVPGGRYLWQVQARIGYDRWVSSELVEFRLVPQRR